MKYKIGSLLMDVNKLVTLFITESNCEDGVYGYYFLHNPEEVYYDSRSRLESRHYEELNV